MSGLAIKSHSSDCDSSAFHRITVPQEHIERAINPCCHRLPHCLYDTGSVHASPRYLEVVDQPSEFGEILCWSGWWDRPRFGVSLVEGSPFYFDCPFSEELDDYPEVFLVWPIPPDELSDELAVWEHFANWRREFDMGNTPPRFQDNSEELARVNRPGFDGDSLALISHATSG